MLIVFSIVESYFEQQVHQIMKLSHSKNDIHVGESILRSCREKSPKILTSLSTEHDHPGVVEVLFNYIKFKQSWKITKLDEVSCYHM